MDVITLTLNPCVDRTMWVHEFEAAPYEEQMQSGGKGLNVARVLGNLGIRCRAFAPLGGERGALCAQLARAEGIALEVVPIAGETRVIDTFVRTRDHAQEVSFGAPPAMAEAEADALYRAVENALPGAKLLAVCGSACCDRAAEVGAKLIARAKDMGVQTLLDAGGAMLALGVQALPGMIKPNQAELSALVGYDVQEGREDVAAGEVIERGIGRVVVSLGERGAALFTENFALYCPAPRIDAVNPVGSGDSFVAGYIYAQLVSGNEYASLSYACAAGAANARAFPAARVTKAEVEELLGYQL